MGEHLPAERPKGFNRYRVVGKSQESAVITSFLLAPVEPVKTTGIRTGGEFLYASFGR